VAALGGGVVYFPPGTYKIDQALTMTGADGVSFAGAGSAASVIHSTNTTADCFTITSSDSLQVRGLSLTHVTTSTGTAFNLDTCSFPSFEDVVHYAGTAEGWRIALSLAASPSCMVINCTFEGESGNAASRGIALGTNSGNLTVIGGRLEGSTGYAIEVSGNSGSCVFIGTQIAGTFSYPAASNGSPFTFCGCSISSIVVGTAFMPVINMLGSTPAGSSTTGATGAAQTPSLVSGRNVQLTADSGGAGVVTVNAPAALPVGTTGQYWDFIFINAAGGAVTWTLNAVFVVSTAIPTTDGHTISVRFWWDPNASKLREASRADTVT
jgi:hypothetical protein